MAKTKKASKNSKASTKSNAKNESPAKSNGKVMGKLSDKIKKVASDIGAASSKKRVKTTTNAKPETSSKEVESGKPKELEPVSKKELPSRTDSHNVFFPVRTVFDDFLNEVSVEGGVELTALAKKLNSDVKTVETWAKILETNGSVRINYGLIKGVRVERVKKSKEE